MRGFRGSRAAQNFKTSRWGRDWNPQTKDEGQFQGNSQQPSRKTPELPAWLRMKEPEAQPKAQKHLRLVTDQTAPVKATAVKAAATKTVRKTAATATRAKAAGTAARKRKAAA